ncbi:MAG: 30S ribosomal protein S2 [Candidatus Azambacteria bacterium]|nr:30S ribosomal protein S2 [Candidatus Azambacteria bacterium]
METKNNILESDVETLALHGVHLGTLRAHSHPKMKSYIWSNKNVFQIIDLEKSKENLKMALDFLIGIKKKGGVILFVGTGFAAKEITKKVAEDLNMPYVTERWLGGTFTNFPTISRRIDYLRNLESQKAAGEFEKYTKYEALKLQEKINKLRKDLGGLINLNRLPDVIWVSSANYDKIAVREAIKKNVPVVGLVNTNSDPTLFNYPIPAGDNAINAVSFILNLVREALINVKIVVPVEPETVGLEKDDKNGKN